MRVRRARSRERAGRPPAVGCAAVCYTTGIGDRTLSTRQLNRALLARHLLLERRRIVPLVAVEQLVGLQAQVPRDPYVALWSRLEGFDASSFSTTIDERRAVRMPLFRATLHLVTRADALQLRPVVHSVLRRGFYSGSPFGRNLDGLDVEPVLAAGRRLLEEAPRTRAELQPLLAERFPGHDAPSLAYACTYLLPTVQVTPRGLWGRSGRSAFTTLESWVGASMPHADAPDDLVLRYLKVFGPATPADFSAWSGLPGAAEILERSRPSLRTFRDEQGRELFDATRAPLPDPETPAPVRFLPEYDNVVLGHDDRSRIVAADTKLWTEVGWGLVLVDGFTAARWRAFLDEGRLRIEPFRTLSRSERADIETEGHRLLAFLGDGAAGEVELVRHEVGQAGKT